MPKVGLIDYGAGNIQSLSNALEHVGAQVQLVRSAKDIDGMTHLVLPGVGAFGFCAERLRAAEIVPAIEEWTFTGRRPILGICVGMQLLADSSEELGPHAGLSWIGGRVERLQSENAEIRIPHVGWNTVNFENDFGVFSKGAQSDFYFDHSYGYLSPREGQTLATCTHGKSFSAAVRRENIVGVQFHPEKSQTSGLRFLDSFLAM